MSLSGFISYKRVGWTGQTPWNPTNLNIMDKGIKDNNDMIANLRSEVSALNNNIINVPHTWINCNGASIFSYFSPGGKDGIYSVYNISDVPEAIAGQYITVIKTNERMFVINHSGLFITEAGSGKWNKIWHAINANKL